MRAAEGGQRNEVRSRSNLDLAPSSELRYLGRSASRQSSLPINRDCQQTATTYLLYQSRTYTEHQIFLAFHKLLKRYMKAQQLVQCMVPRALFGGVWNTSKVGVLFPACSSYVFSFFGLSCTLFPVRSRCVFFPLPSNHFARQKLCRTERKYAFADVLGSGRQNQLTDRKNKCQNNY